MPMIPFRARSISLPLAALLLPACGPQTAEEREPALDEAARGSETISNAHFTRQTVPCTSDSTAMSRALFELTKRDLPSDARVRLVDYASDDIRLRDGPGQIVVIVYAVAPENGAESTTTEHFLINQDCRVLHWRSAVNVIEEERAS